MTGFEIVKASVAFEALDPVRALITWLGASGLDFEFAVESELAS